MALQIPYTDAHGVDHAAAYGRINWYACRCEIGQQSIVDYVIQVYASQEARLSGREPLAAVEGQMPVDDAGPIRRSDLYAHAHTLPEFAEAEDA